MKQSEIKAEGMKSYQFKSMIINDIKTGKLSPGEAIGSAKELSDKYGIPYITINRVMAELGEKGYLNRIKGKGTFVSPDLTPAVPKRRFGLCFDDDLYRKDTANGFSAFGIFAFHARSVLKEKGYDIFDFTVNELLDPQFDRKYQIDALLAPSNIPKAAIPLLVGKKLPVAVVQHSSFFEYPFHQVIPDIMGGFLQITKLLRENDVRTIHVLYTDNYTACSRVEVFQQAAKWEGIPEDAIKLFCNPFGQGDFGQLTGYRMARQLLKNFEPGSVIFSPSDFLSFGIVNAFFEEEMVAGRDFHLISFDNLEDESLLPFGRPLLTSLDFPKREIIERAIQLLEEKIDRPSPELVTIRVPAELVIRETFKPIIKQEVIS